MSLAEQIEELRAKVNERDTLDQQLAEAEERLAQDEAFQKARRDEAQANLLTAAAEAREARERMESLIPQAAVTVQAYRTAFERYRAARNRALALGVKVEEPVEPLSTTSEGRKLMAEWPGSITV